MTYIIHSSQTNIEHKSCKNCISSNVNIASACTIKLFAGASANLTTWVTVILRCKVSQSEVTVITITSSIINHFVSAKLVGIFNCNKWLEVKIRNQLFWFVIVELIVIEISYEFAGLLVIFFKNLAAFRYFKSTLTFEFFDL